MFLCKRRRPIGIGGGPLVGAAPRRESSSPAQAPTHTLTARSPTVWVTKPDPGASTKVT